MRKPEMGAGSFSALSDNSEPVGVVHHKGRAVFFLKTDDFGEICDVPAHAEHAVGDNKYSRALRHLLQRLFERIHVSVLISQHRSAAKPAAVVNAGVIFPVAYDKVVLADNGAYNAEI